MKKTYYVRLSAILLIFALVLCGCTSSPTTSDPGEVESAPPTESTDVPESSIPETDWPTRAVSIIVGANPGGGQDAAGRLYAKYLQEYLGQSFPIVNVNGAGSSIAAKQVLDAKADGQTILLMNENIVSNQLSGVSDFSYEAFDFAGIGLISQSVGIFSHSDRFQTFDQVIEEALANPGTVITGTEIGGTSHQQLQAIMRELGVDLQIVDGGAVGDRISSLMGGHIDISIMPMGNVKDYVATGDFVPLVLLNEERVEPYMDIPVITEFDADVISYKFFGMFFNKGTNPAIVAKLSETLKEISEDPEFIAEAEALDCVPTYISELDYLADVYSIMENY